MRRAIFLDRDGVINRSKVTSGVPLPPTCVADIVILEGVVEAINIFKALEFIPVVITNQPDVARGRITRDEVIAINDFIGAATCIEHFYTCFHDDVDACNCRKPLPGLIYQAAKELKLDIPNSYIVGDRWRDVSAGQAAGCKTYFIDYSYSEITPEMPFTRVSSLLEAAQAIAGGSSGAR